MILVVDFGSQTAHLIKRRITDLGVSAKLIQPEMAMKEIRKNKPSGIIFSGGPASVYEKGAPTVNKRVFELGIPILGICYGQQLIAHILPNGKTVRDKAREDGPATLIIDHECILFRGVSPHSRIWMSHGDTVVKPPRGFELVAHSETISSAAMKNEEKKIYGLQFHPEVEHTEHGQLILRNFIELVCKVKLAKQKFESYKIIESIRKKVKNKYAIAAVSGGLDSTVAATLVATAIGKQLVPIHVESGLMRTGTTERVLSFFKKHLGITPVILKKEKEFLKALKGITGPEQKRKIIGKLYIDLFDQECKKHKNVGFLVQGTIYSDVIESKGSRHAANIKSHHNVGGLPKDLKLELIEPIRDFYTDQVRALAKELKIPNDFITEQPHPGPGYAIRVVGELTPERLSRIQKADQIVVEEMKKSGWYKKVLHSFAILTGTSSTSVKGDGRVYGEVVALRIVTSRDRMTADWAKPPYDLLQRMVSRITNAVPGVSRVVYDITTKPPATIEWE
jgi:GMP synthase (glutamine-hydrolysing)